jgi:ATP-binding cassette, subfamily B, bacterial PglK
MNNLSKIKKILNTDFYLIYLLLFLTFVGAIFEILSIASFIPLIFDLFNNEINISNQFLNSIFSKIKLNYSTQELIVFLVIILIFKNIYLILNTYLSFYILDKIYLITLSKILRNKINLKYQNFIKMNTGEFIKDTKDIIKIFREYIHCFNYFISEVLVSILIIFLLANINVKITFMSVILITLFISIYYLITKTIIKKLSVERLKYEEKQNSFLIKIFNSILEIKIFNKENLFKEKAFAVFDNFTKINRYYFFINNLPKYLIELFLIVILCFFIIFFSSEFNLTNSLPYIGLFLVALFRLMPSFNRINTNKMSMKYNEVSLDNILKNFSYKNIMAEKERYNLKENITFKNVSFNYENNNKTILKNFNFKFDLGKIIGIIGPSGIGKSTICKLITSLIEPSEGSIYIDKKKILEFKKKNYLNIGYVGQKFFLMKASLAENIAMKFDINDEDIEKVNVSLKKAKCEEFLNQKKITLDTIIDEDAVQFSGGQRQRLAIARALFNNPNIIVLDEATSFLDEETEREILKYFILNKNKYLIIIISHRKNILNLLDKRIEL